MAERWAGIQVSGEKVTLVDINVPDDEGAYEIIADKTFTLQAGDRSQAYKVMHDRLNGYIRENKISKAILKESALPLKGSPKLALLHSAELRGVAMAAAASACETKTVAKASISRRFGKRKADEYLRDDEFWEETIEGADLRAGSREAALLIISSAKKKAPK